MLCSEKWECSGSTKNVQIKYIIVIIRKLIPGYREPHDKVEINSADIFVQQNKITPTTLVL